MKLETRFMLLSLVLFTWAGCAGMPNTRRDRFTAEQLAYVPQLEQVSLEFELAKTDVPDAWGRAQSFIATHSSMKLQLVTDYILQTYNPTGWGDYGYYVTKTPAGDKVQITIRGLAGVDTVLWGSFKASERGPSKPLTNARILAHYMQTDKLPHPELISK